MSEPKVIYLGPACEAETGDGRTWAEDNPWPDCECGHRPVQYVLGETFNRMKAERDALQLRLNAADQRIDELTAKPSDAERERLMEIIERYPNGDPLQYNAAVKEVSKIIGIERMPPMEYDEP